MVKIAYLAVSISVVERKIFKALFITLCLQNPDIFVDFLMIDQVFE